MKMYIDSVDAANMGGVLPHLPATETGAREVFRVSPWTREVVLVVDDATRYRLRSADGPLEALPPPPREWVNSLSDHLAAPGMFDW